ncbi:hypothetical protein LTR39_006896, partial [Cryomyces antarcticus]
HGPHSRIPLPPRAHLQHLTPCDLLLRRRRPQHPPVRGPIKDPTRDTTGGDEHTPARRGRSSHRSDAQVCRRGSGGADHGGCEGGGTAGVRWRSSEGEGGTV